jgi:hypothetical protein
MRIESEGDLECVVTKLKASFKDARVAGKALCIKITTQRPKKAKKEVTFRPAEAAL